ncbi:MAG: FCSD flavin-binding domain-containing protein [Glaciimonas sp.]|nr:FCSD flavin-binding domain-containing protein [Glaciimonas sp.]
MYRYNILEKRMKLAEGGGISAHASAQKFREAQYWALNIWSDVLS